MTTKDTLDKYRQVIESVFDIVAAGETIPQAGARKWVIYQATGCLDEIMRMANKQAESEAVK